eukprot:1480289-Pyramimonas_sp.AAC.1
MDLPLRRLFGRTPLSGPVRRRQPRFALRARVAKITAFRLLGMVAGAIRMGPSRQDNRASLVG